jgi:hypothetical protein
MLRLVVVPDSTVRADPPGSAGRPVRFTATLDGDFVVLSDQPLVDSARELLARGFDPVTLLTLRHQGKAYDSFEPLPIVEWADMTYSEGEKGDLRRRRWMPRPADREGKKQGSDAKKVAEPILPRPVDL